MTTQAKPFQVIGIDGADGSATELESFEWSSLAIDWARRYVSKENAGNWDAVHVLDTRSECAETVWRWEAAEEEVA